MHASVAAGENATAPARSAYAGARRGELPRALASLPAFFVLRVVNAYLLLKALALEVLLRRPLTVYEKGH